jgi:hypothetical protein
MPVLIMEPAGISPEKGRDKMHATPPGGFYLAGMSRKLAGSTEKCSSALLHDTLMERDPPAVRFT